MPLRGKTRMRQVDSMQQHERYKPNYALNSNRLATLDIPNIVPNLIILIMPTQIVMLKQDPRKDLNFLNFGF